MHDTPIADGGLGASSTYPEPLCADCHHGHIEGAWNDTDPNDGTCWEATSFVCGCPKFITPQVKRFRDARGRAR